MCRPATVLAFVFVLAVSVPAGAADDLASEAARQLQLAEADLADGAYQRAAESAASAYRLDATLQSALVVQGLALRHLGRDVEARALLVTYRTLRGDLPRDARVGPAILLIDLAEDIRVEPSIIVRAAEASLLTLDTAVARELISYLLIEGGGAGREVQRRGLELLAESLWIDDDQDAARRTWRRLFVEHAEAVVDPELPPPAMTAMAEEQGVARGASSPASSRGTGSNRGFGSTSTRPQAPEAFVLLGSGSAAAAIGFGLAGGSYARGSGVYDDLSTSPTSWDSDIESYRSAFTAERVGIAVGFVGTALLTAGLLRLVADRVEAKKRSFSSGPAQGGAR